MTRVVYTAVEDGSTVKGMLFNGTKFWLSHRLPTRSTFIEQVQSNGGVIVPLETQADMMIVDHVRTNNPPGTYSYQYIEQSIRKGRLEDPENHQVGPPIGTIRAVGSVEQPTRGFRRVKFTAEEDRLLYQWVAEYQSQGKATAGNKIYQMLEAKNGRHTWQSWRNRWVKQLQYIKPSDVVPIAALSSPTTHRIEPELPTANRTLTEEAGAAFSPEDAKALFKIAESILLLDSDKEDDAWRSWAKTYPHHSTQEWRDFWETSICPEYLSNESEASKNNSEHPKPRSVKHQVLHKNSPNQSGSLALRSKRGSKGEENMRVASSDDFEDSHSVVSADSVELPTLNTTPNPIRSLKRKLCPESEKLPHSSPLKSQVTNKAKRLRFNPVREIPSTRENSPLNENSRELLRTFVDVANVPTDLENSDEDCEEDEDEDDGDEPIMRGVSQSLFEPDPTRSSPAGKMIGQTSPAHECIESHTNSNANDDDTYEHSETTEEDIDSPSEDHDHRAHFQTIQALPEARRPDSAEADERVDTPVPPSSPPLSSSPPSGPGSVSEEDATEGTTSSQDHINAELDRWIDDQVLHGQRIQDVHIALECTTMNLELAEIVLHRMKRSDGRLPFLRGVWTEEDDGLLRGADAGDEGGWETLVGKHGREGVDGRLGF